MVVGVERNVNIVVELLGRLTSSRAARGHARTDDTNDDEISQILKTFETDCFAKRVLEREKLIGNIRNQHGDIAHPGLILIRQKTPRRHFELMDGGILRSAADQPTRYVVLQI